MKSKPPTSTSQPATQWLATVTVNGDLADHADELAAAIAADATITADPSGATTDVTLDISADDPAAATAAAAAAVRQALAACDLAEPIVGAQALTHQEHARRQARELVGPAEIATMLGVSRQRVHQLTKRPDFPQPVTELALGQLWDRDVIVKYRDTPRPTGRPRSPRP